MKTKTACAQREPKTKPLSILCHILPEFEVALSERACDSPLTWNLSTTPSWLRSPRYYPDGITGRANKVWWWSDTTDGGLEDRLFFFVQKHGKMVLSHSFWQWPNHLTFCQFLTFFALGHLMKRHPFFQVLTQLSLCIAFHWVFDARYTQVKVTIGRQP